MTAPKRRLRWSLRTMFVAVTVVCVWLGFQLKLVRERQRITDFVRDHNGYATESKDGTGVPFWRLWMNDTAVKEITYDRNTRFPKDMNPAKNAGRVP
jgi:hypothetical protein